MSRTFFALTLAAALAGCNQQDQSEADAANAAADAAPIVLPPSIIASKIYRCKDNSIVYIDWLSDNKSANLRTEKNGPASLLVAPEVGQPMVAEGFSLTGAAADSNVSLTRPDKGVQSCHV